MGCVMRINRARRGHTPLDPNAPPGRAQPRFRSAVKILKPPSRTNPLQQKAQSPMIAIHHNPRCSKSRAACELITSTYNNANEATEVIEYLKQPLTVAQLKELNA